MLTRRCLIQVLVTHQKAQAQQQGHARLHRRLQRLQDERVHLEGLLAHERSLLAQQQSDNAQLRSQLSAYQQNGGVQLHSWLSESQQDEDSGPTWLPSNGHKLHRRIHGHQQDRSAKEQQQHANANAVMMQPLSMQHGQMSQSCDLHDQQGSQPAGDRQLGDSRQQLQHQLLQFEAELAMIESEKTALHSQLRAQQGQQDSDLAVLRLQLSAEQEECRRLREKLSRLSCDRLDECAWQARAVQLDAQHANMVSELDAAHAQCTLYHRQVCSEGLSL